MGSGSGHRRRSGWPTPASPRQVQTHAAGQRRWCSSAMTLVDSARSAARISATPPGPAVSPNTPPPAARSGLGGDRRRTPASGWAGASRSNSTSNPAATIRAAFSAGGGSCAKSTSTAKRTTSSANSTDGCSATSDASRMAQAGPDFTSIQAKRPVQPQRQDVGAPADTAATTSCNSAHPEPQTQPRSGAPGWRARVRETRLPYKAGGLIDVRTGQLSHHCRSARRGRGSSSMRTRFHTLDHSG